MCHQSKLLLHSVILLSGIVAGTARAQTQSEIAAQQLLRQQQRDKAQTEQIEESRPDVRLPRTSVQAAAAYPAGETPCFPIKQIVLTGEGRAIRVGAQGGRRRHRRMPWQRRH